MSQVLRSLSSEYYLASVLQLAAARDKAQAALELEMTAESHDEWHDRFGNEARKGCDILVQALEREQVRTVFAYPGGCSMEIHQALTRSPIIRNILCRHEQVRQILTLAVYL